MHQQEELFAPDVVNETRNSRLISAISAITYSPSKRNENAFIQTLIESNLILLSLEAPRPPSGYITRLDEEGFGYYGIDTKISLVQLNSHLKDHNNQATKQLMLPVFTESSYVHKIPGLSDFHGLAMSAIDVLELCIIAKSEILSINPGSKCQLDISRDSVEELVINLRKNGFLPQKESLLVDSHIDF